MVHLEFGGTFISIDRSPLQSSDRSHHFNFSGVTVVIVVAEVLTHVTCYSIGVYPRSAIVVLTLAEPHFSISVSRFLVENI